MRYNSGAGAYINAGLVRHGCGSDVMTQRTLVEVVTVTGVSEGRVSEQRSGTVAHDGGAGAYIQTRLVRDSGRSGYHSRSDSDGVSHGCDEPGCSVTVVSIQSFSLQVKSTGIDHFSGVQGTTAGVQYHSW